MYLYIIIGGYTTFTEKISTKKRSRHTKKFLLIKKQDEPEKKIKKLGGKQHMVKKQLTLTIDSELLEFAKNNIPNLSKFFEECIKIGYLKNDEDSIYAIGLQIHTKRKQIKQLYYELRMLQLQEEFELNRKEYDPEAQRKERIWLDIKQEITKRKHDKKWEWMDKKIVEEAEEVLGYDKRTLMRIMNFVDREMDKFNVPIEKASLWQYVEPEWKKYNGGIKKDGA